MPYYVYLNSEGEATSPGYTIAPQDMEKLSETFSQVPEPMTNPVYDNGEFREMTVAEITAANEAAETAAKLARNVFTQLEIREAFKALDKEADLDALLNGNAEFKNYWTEAQEIDLNHAVTVQALANFTEEEINALKMEI
jgi:hypothetical protein